jgi:hypothetical protein
MNENSMKKLMERVAKSKAFKYWVIFGHSFRVFLLDK